MQYLPPIKSGLPPIIKSGLNIRNPNKFYLFTITMIMDTRYKSVIYLKKRKKINLQRIP
jgi:hypothetical protein